MNEGPNPGYWHAPPGAVGTIVLCNPAQATYLSAATSHATGLAAARQPFHFTLPCSAPAPGRAATAIDETVQRMAKEELLTLDGQIDEILPDGRFGVILENNHRIVAYTAGKMRKFRIKSIVGDRVRVEMTPYDLTKGRIVYREKIGGPGGPAGQRRR
jgi:translation initiation factor IF-1